jgi:hypothetical protein
MVSTKEWYQRVNIAWPSDMRTPTPGQAINAVRRLYRWGIGENWTGPIKLTSGRNYTWTHSGVFMVNPDASHHGGGWKALIHDLSHYLWRKANKGMPVRPHEKGHAKLELAMIKQVIKRGWLQPPVDKIKPVPAKGDKIKKVYDRLQKRRMDWQRKERRAVNALKKLKRQMVYYEKRLSV